MMIFLTTGILIFWYCVLVFFNILLFKSSMLEKSFDFDRKACRRLFFFHNKFNVALYSCNPEILYSNNYIH